MVTEREIEEYQGMVQDQFIEIFGDDFDYYIDQDLCFSRSRLSLAIEKGITPEDYAGMYI